jgi:hypothetical protein
MIDCNDKLFKNKLNYEFLIFLYGPKSIINRMIDVQHHSGGYEKKNNKKNGTSNEKN